MSITQRSSSGQVASLGESIIIRGSLYWTTLATPLPVSRMGTLHSPTFNFITAFAFGLIGSIGYAIWGRDISPDMQQKFVKAETQSGYFNHRVRSHLTAIDKTLTSEIIKKKL